jgi:hypothetical protein
MKNPDLTRWLLKVRDALAEPDETTRNSMLRAADRFLKRNNQSLAPGGTGMDKFQTRESPNQFVQPQRAVGSRARN